MIFYNITKNDKLTKRTVTMPRKTTFTDNQYQGHKLTEKNLTFNKNAMKKILEMTNSMIARHSKVLQIRFDLRYPQDHIPPQSTSRGRKRSDFSKAMQAVTQELNRKHLDVQYIGKEERENSIHPHAHFGLQINGNKKQYRNSILPIVEKHWGHTLNIPAEEVHRKQLVFPCNKDGEGNPRANGYRIDRNDILHFQDQKDAAIRQLSYLAKEREGDTLPKGTRRYYFSQYQKDYDKDMERRKKWGQRRKGSSHDEAEGAE